MSKSIVVLDTNILVKSNFLRSKEWADLHAHAKDWGLRFVVPEVVVMETVNLDRRQVQSKREELARLERFFGGLGRSEEYEAVFSAAEAQYEDCEAALRGRIGELELEIVPLPDVIDHMGIARRAAEARAPYSSGQSGKKDGYRDTLIWLTVLSVAEREPECDVWFVSDNYSDFGAKPERKDERDNSDYPLDWHKDLGEELNRSGFTGRVFYARALNRLEQHLLSTFNPLENADRDKRWALVGHSELYDRLSLALVGESIDPRAGALPLETSSAIVLDSDRPWSDAVRISEAAHRGAGGWTTQFRWRVVTTIEVTNMLGDVSVETKPLVVSGRITLNANSAITELTVEAMEADLDDPQRRAWERKDAATKSVPPSLRAWPDDSMYATLTPQTLQAIRAMLANQQFTTPSPEAIRAMLANQQFTTPSPEEIRAKFGDGEESNQEDDKGRR